MISEPVRYLADMRPEVTAKHVRFAAKIGTIAVALGLVAVAAVALSRSRL